MVPCPFLIPISAALTTVTAAATAAIATSPAAAGSTLRFRTSFINSKRTAIKFPAAEGFDGTIPFRVHAHFDEGKALLLPRIAVRNNTDAIDSSVFLKQGSDRVFGRVKTEISYKNILHDLLSEFGERRIGAGSDKGGWAGLSKDAKSTNFKLPL